MIENDDDDDDGNLLGFCDTLQESGGIYLMSREIEGSFLIFIGRGMVCVINFYFLENCIGCIECNVCNYYFEEKLSVIEEISNEGEKSWERSQSI